MNDKNETKRGNEKKNEKNTQKASSDATVLTLGLLYRTLHRLLLIDPLYNRWQVSGTIHRQFTECLKFFCLCCLVLIYFLSFLISSSIFFCQLAFALLCFALQLSLCCLHHSFVPPPTYLSPSHLPYHPPSYPPSLHPYLSLRSVPITALLHPKTKTDPILSSNIPLPPVSHPSPSPTPSL